MKRLVVTLLLVLVSVTPAWSQQYTQRGFLESRFTLYPVEAANDRARTVGEALFRYEGFLQTSGNSFNSTLGSMFAPIRIIKSDATAFPGGTANHDVHSRQSVA